MNNEKSKHFECVCLSRECVYSFRKIYNIKIRKRYTENVNDFLMRLTKKK